jgi:superfamily I DNA/RNA helicase
VKESRFTQRFLWDEWANVVDAWQLSSWEEYRDVQRLGRKTRLAETQRQMLWGIFEQVRRQLHDTGRTTLAEAFAQAAAGMEKEANAPFDFVVVDEAQDMGVPELRFLAALGGKRDNGLFFTGDLGQRIFQQPFSWKSLGVDIRGRSHTLRINYRTSHQIRRQADRLLPNKLTDFDGNEESRSGTVSVFNGPSPVIQIMATPDEEAKAVGDWLKSLIAEDYRPHEIGVFVRSVRQIARAKQAIQHAELPCIELTENVTVRADHVSLGVMHLAKGLEFRAVAVMACDDEALPLQERIESVGDMADLEDVYNTERHLLYVACTRARDRLIVTGVEPPSEFLDDLITSR